MIDELLTKNMLPDFLIRIGIRRLLKERLREENYGPVEAQHGHLMEYVETLRSSPIAVDTRAANEQHYEAPTEFFKYVLGKNMKYSSCYYSGGVTNLDMAEDVMLEKTCARADLKNGQKILELGCGWGSLSLYMAKKFPMSRITAVSNSRTQKIYIDSEAEKRGIKNLTIVTADMNVFDTSETFDRCVSVEMFEHMKNYGLLFENIGRWLNAEGKLFIHIFTHREYAYPFEVRSEKDWMAKYFFTGGQMPSDHLLFYFSEKFQIENHWRVSGVHYQKTSEAWLSNMDRHCEEIDSLFRTVYGKDYIKWRVYWRVFFMSCAELWGFRKGEEWFVSHYLFKKSLGRGN